MGPISHLLIVPLLGAAAVVLFGQRSSRARGLALAASVAAWLPIPALWMAFDPNEVGYQLVESSAWIPSLGASYLVGVDAVSLGFVILTALVAPFGVLGSWNQVKEAARGYYSNLLFLETALLGMFLAIDLLLFTSFLLVSLFCLGLLISHQGGRDRARATLRFWLVTMGSSLLLLAVFAACHHIHFIQSGTPSFDARQWVDLVLHPNTETWLFWLAFTAFGCLVPLIPFSFWLQASVQEASVAGRALLCGVLVKVGVFGLLQFVIPWFPRAAHTYAPLIGTLAVVSLLYGAVTLAFESDLARVLARVTAIHMGLAVFGLFSLHPDGVEGAVVLVLSHGILITAWFAWMGMLEKRTWYGEVPELIGLRGGMPRGTGLLTVLSAATVGVPAFGTSVGLFLVSRGSWESGYSTPFKAMVAGIAVLGMVVVFVKIVKKAFGRKGEHQRKDLEAREVWVLIPLLLLVVWMGVQPARVLEQLERVTDHFLSRVSEAASLTE